MAAASKVCWATVWELVDFPVPATIHLIEQEKGVCARLENVASAGRLIRASGGEGRLLCQGGRSELCLRRILGLESSALDGGDVQLGGVAVVEGYCHRDGARGGRAVDMEDGHPG